MSVFLKNTHTHIEIDLDPPVTQATSISYLTADDKRTSGDIS